jgi:hypothetical protein
MQVVVVVADIPLLVVVLATAAEQQQRHKKVVLAMVDMALLVAQAQQIQAVAVAALVQRVLTTVGRAVLA